jgi:threonine synthase
MATLQESITLATVLQCPQCGRQYDMTTTQSYATCCNQPLATQYDLSPHSTSLINTDVRSMWRYAAVMPVFDERNIVTLGEGWTPIHHLEYNVLLKDESVNPTGSFKARGISAGISKAKELGITHCIIPTAGNAGGALSAYCAKAGIQATVIMPRHTPATLQEECRLYGAELILVDGLIDDCGKLARQLVQNTGAFDFSTMKEPYRLEGKKTMGYEIAEQLNWVLPDVIIYPTGGGTGLIGMWKAFREMQQLGWLSGPLPRMVAVQSANCDPVVKLFNGSTEPFKPRASVAYGLAVPAPFAKDMMMTVLHESNGLAITVTEGAIEAGIKELARTKGMLLSPEGAATYVGLQQLLEDGKVHPEETVLLFNTGSWYKYR